MKVLLAAIIGLAGQALAGGVETWPSHDVDLGRVFTAQDGSGAMVLVSRVHAYADSLDAWFGPRVDALAGDGVQANLTGIEILPDDAFQQGGQLLGDGVGPVEIVATGYVTPAGNQMIVVIGRSEAADTYVAAHRATGDVWTGAAWEPPAPLPEMDTTGLECRMEQQPSVVWVINRVCESACALAPTSDMTLIDAEVCREPR